MYAYFCVQHLIVWAFACVQGVAVNVASMQILAYYKLPAYSL